MIPISRAIRRARRSIAARLSLMLIVVFVVVLAGIGANFYQLLNDDFAARTRTELDSRSALVRRVLGELRSLSDIRAQGEFIEGLLAGHHRLRVVILDGGGSVLYRSPGFAEPGSTLLERIRERPAAGIEGNFEHRGRDKFLVKSTKARIGGGAPVWVAIAHDLRDEDVALTSHGRAMLISLSLGAALAALGGLWVIRASLAPVTRIAAAAERVSANRLDARLPVEDAPLELVRLVQAFNSMFDRLKDSFRRLSDFSSDLAHELRTPINSLLGHAQVALSRARSAEEYRGAIETIAEDGERVARIVRDMLFLAQADNTSAILSKERLDLRAELDNVVAYFDVLADERGVRFACEGVAEVRADRAMLQRAVSNLLSNALYHTPRGGTVLVNIRSADSRAACLEVSNPGPAIPAEHLPRIFDRFYQADPARVDPAGGIGLGLAIVKSIMDLHGGSVEAASAPGGLTTFRLIFRS